MRDNGNISIERFSHNNMINAFHVLSVSNDSTEY